MLFQQTNEEQDEHEVIENAEREIDEIDVQM